MQEKPKLIVVSSSGFDNAGWPLSSQLDVCQAVAEQYHAAAAAEKPLILANALGIPTKYRVDDPVLGGPVVQSKQTALLLANMGVDPNDIVCGQFAIDTIGEGLELLTLLQPKHENVQWMEEMCGNKPIAWNERAASFQRSLSDSKPHVIFAGPEFQVERSALINTHMLEMAGQPFTSEIMAVPATVTARVNLVADKDAMAAHIAAQKERYKNQWATIKEIGEFFDALRSNHGLFNDGPYVFHSNADTPIQSHSGRPDLERLYGLYQKPRPGAYGANPQQTP